MKIPKDKTILLPIFTIKTKQEEDENFRIANISSIKSESGHYHDIFSATLDAEDVKNLLFIGPAILPESIIVDEEEIEQPILIHEFDFYSMYIDSEIWDCGSCPHIFIKTKNDVKYLGEVFNEQEKISSNFEIIAPENSTKFVLYEIENEITVIEWISINGNIVIRNKKLNIDESISLEILPGDVISGRGYYTLLTNNGKKLALNVKNLHIKKAMKKIIDMV